MKACRLKRGSGVALLLMKGYIVCITLLYIFIFRSASCGIFSHLSNTSSSSIASPIQLDLESTSGSVQKIEDELTVNESSNVLSPDFSSNKGDYVSNSDKDLSQDIAILDSGSSRRNFLGLVLDSGHSLVHQSAALKLIIVLTILAVLDLFLIILAHYSHYVKAFLFFKLSSHRPGSKKHLEFIVRRATHMLVSSKHAKASRLVELNKSSYMINFVYHDDNWIFNSSNGLFEPLGHFELSNYKCWNGLINIKDYMLPNTLGEIYEMAENILNNKSLSNTTKRRSIEESCYPKAKAEFNVNVDVLVDINRSKYGQNDYQIPKRDFFQMLLKAVLSPFFITQIFSVVLWMLDDYWYYGLLSLFGIFSIEIQMILKRIREYDRINSMRLNPLSVYVYRNLSWTLISSLDLLPGDIYILPFKSNSLRANAVSKMSRIVPYMEAPPLIVPADTLLLQGYAICDESILTGESIPQIKVALPEDESPYISDSKFFMDNLNKQHMLYAGTRVVLVKCDQKSFKKRKTPILGCVGVVTKTGFYTCQGKLVKSLLHTGDNIEPGTVNTWLFIGLLLIAAIVACWTVVDHYTSPRYKGVASVYKLVLMCSHIITYVIPAEFPITLSLSVTISIAQLYRLGIYCSEPSRLPFGGSIDICSFDKTGTLTSDQMRLLGIFGLEERDARIKEDEMLNCLDSSYVLGPRLPFITAAVIGGCNSLVKVNDGIVGDPMEKEAFNALNWNIVSQDNVELEIGGKHERLSIIKRFPFASHLQRMTCVVHHSGYGQEWSTEGRHSAAPASAPSQGYLVLTKGSPEVIKEMLNVCPPTYVESFKYFTRRGYRVLAMAAKWLPNQSLPSEESNQREILESKLDFAGFLVMECPMKPSSKVAMEILRASSHRLIMITGDNPLTACHVAAQSKLVVFQGVEPGLVDFAILQSTEPLEWTRRDGSFIQRFEDSDIGRLAQKYVLCVLGAALQSVIKQFPYHTIDLIKYSTIFARFSPQQKAFCISTLKRLSHTVLMCGDGTNDMAALKAAHIGVSLFGRECSSSFPSSDALCDDFSISTMQDFDEMPQIKLGEASIASPFTYIGNDVRCIPLLISSGRCALSTANMLYKLMAINSLMTAISVSILAIDGVQFGDIQSAITSFFYTYMVVIVSKAPAAKKLGQRRPEHSIFTPFNLITLCLQILVHWGILFRVWDMAKLCRDPSYVPDLDAPFEANVVNTSIYYISFAMNISMFVCNYQGHPFIQPLLYNKTLYLSLSSGFAFLTVLIFEIIPPINDWLSLVRLSRFGLVWNVFSLSILDIALPAAVCWIIKLLYYNV